MSYEHYWELLIDLARDTALNEDGSHNFWRMLVAMLVLALTIAAAFGIWVYFFGLPARPIAK